MKLLKTVTSGKCYSLLMVILHGIHEMHSVRRVTENRKNKRLVSEKHQRVEAAWKECGGSVWSHPSLSFRLDIGHIIILALKSDSFRWWHSLFSAQGHHAPDMSSLESSWYEMLCLIYSDLDTQQRFFSTCKIDEALFWTVYGKTSFTSILESLNVLTIPLRE